MLQAGDDYAASTINNLNGAVITGNRFTWNGAYARSVITHGLFTGNNINVAVKYNYLDKVPMAIIRKASVSMSNTSGDRKSVV